MYLTSIGGRRGMEGRREGGRESAAKFKESLGLPLPATREGAERTKGGSQHERSLLSSSEALENNKVG